MWILCTHAGWRSSGKNVGPNLAAGLVELVVLIEVWAYCCTVFPYGTFAFPPSSPLPQAGQQYVMDTYVRFTRNNVSSSFVLFRAESTLLFQRPAYPSPLLTPPCVVYSMPYRFIPYMYANKLHGRIGRDLVHLEKVQVER